MIREEIIYLFKIEVNKMMRNNKLIFYYYLFLIVELETETHMIVK